MMKHNITSFVFLLFCIYINFEIHEAGRVRRIVGGELVPKGDAPMIISLKNITNKRHFCGGALVRWDLAMTAAHCVDGPASDYSVHLDNLHLDNDNRVNDFLTMSPVSKIYVHSKYEKKTSAHDIAILKLKRGFHNLNISMENFLPKSIFGLTGDCSIYGYGATFMNDPSIYNELRKTNVDIISEEDCEELLGKYIAPNPGSGMICAMGNNSDACQGDSGSPMLCGGILEGIVSYGTGCGFNDLPGVYTRVAAHMDWITATMKETFQIK